MQEPGTREGATILLRRLELPVARGFESDACEVGAWAVRGVLGVADCATWVDADANDHADCAVNSVARAL